jgi:hypothetical protein
MGCEDRALEEIRHHDDTDDPNRVPNMMRARHERR